MRTSTIRTYLVWSCDHPGCPERYEHPFVFDDGTFWPPAWTNIGSRDLCPKHSVESFHAMPKDLTTAQWECQNSHHHWGHPDDNDVSQCIHCGITSDEYSSQE